MHNELKLSGLNTKPPFRGNIGTVIAENGGEDNVILYLMLARYCLPQNLPTEDRKTCDS